MVIDHLPASCFFGRLILGRPRSRIDHSRPMRFTALKGEGVRDRFQREEQSDSIQGPFSESTGTHLARPSDFPWPKERPQTVQTQYNAGLGTINRQG